MYRSRGRAPRQAPRRALSGPALPLIAKRVYKGLCVDAVPQRRAESLELEQAALLRPLSADGDREILRDQCQQLQAVPSRKWLNLLAVKLVDPGSRSHRAPHTAW